MSQVYSLRRVLSGHAPPVRRVLHVTARRAVSARLAELVALIQVSPGAPLVWGEHGAPSGDPRTAQALVLHAEWVSRILGYAYGSYHGTRACVCTWDRCAHPLGWRQMHASTGIGITPTGLVHRDCLPAPRTPDHGFVAWEPGADALRWLAEAFARMDAGHLRPLAHPCVRERYAR